ncbi:rho-related GTP-binding protein RhoC [Elysia marginata]|uniref:Rho-related GTP-binding protein RhoC n=1 Tax=Elysia marginata TaxID=1093978 RepID=A0AAV4I0H8_9GAST|nr:rho-related GTP-binding protein RhoC [Elysia marginata]
MNQKGSRCANQIEEVCKEVEKTINQTIQNTLNSLERDCDQIAQLVDDKLKEDSLQGSRNLRARFRGFCYGVVGLTLPLLLLATFLISTSHSTLATVLGDSLMITLDIYLGPLSTAWKRVPQKYTQHIIGGILVMGLVMLLLARFSSRTVTTLTRKQKKKLNEISEFVQKTVKSKKQTLYQEYLQQSVAEQDL